MGLSALSTTAVIATALALILGIAAYLLLKKKPVTAGVLFIVSASLTTTYSFLGALFFLLNGVFALIKEQPFVPAPCPPGRAAMYPPPYPPYTQPAPPYPHPPYGTQAAPPPPHPSYHTYSPPAAPAFIVNKKEDV